MSSPPPPRTGAAWPSLRATRLHAVPENSPLGTTTPKPPAAPGPLGATNPPAVLEPPAASEPPAAPKPLAAREPRGAPRPPAALAPSGATTPPAAPKPPSAPPPPVPEAHATPAGTRDTHRPHPPRSVRADGKFVSVPHVLTADQQARLDAVLAEFDCVFSKGPDDIGRVSPDLITHSINTPTGPVSRPRHYQARRLAKAESVACEELIQSMKRADLIRDAPLGAGSDYCAAVVMVRKPDLTWRMTIDFRDLNAATLPERCIMPDAAAMLRRFARCKFFTVIDYVSGFWNILMNPADVYKTRFVTESGMYEWLRMPMGLCGAPATQQRLTTLILKDVTAADGFMDDCLLGDETFDSHLDTIRDTLGAIKEANVKIKRSKFFPVCMRVKALGHIMSDEGVGADQEHIAVIKNLPAPRDRTGVSRLLGMCGYWADHIAYYSEITAPIRLLLLDQTPFRWGPNQQAAFDALKELLTSAPVLRGADWDLVFYLTTDWSKLALGAVLSQIDPLTEREHAIAYASRACTPAESDYSATRGECKALHWAITKFRYYLFGRPFKVRTDHEALAYMRTAQYTDITVHRWVLSLQEYDFTAVHTPGDLNPVADYLSRGAGRIARAMKLPPAQELPEVHILPKRKQRSKSLTPEVTTADIPSPSAPTLASMAIMSPVPRPDLRAKRARASLAYIMADGVRPMPLPAAQQSARPTARSPSQQTPAMSTASLSGGQYKRAKVDSAAECRVCLMPDAPRQMLCCDGCNATFHAHCLFPPEDGITSAAWKCQDCRDPTDLLCGLRDPDTPLQLSPLDPYSVPNLHALVWAHNLPGGVARHMPNLPPAVHTALRPQARTLTIHPTLKAKDGSPWLQCWSKGTWHIVPPLHYRWNIMRSYHARLGHAGVTKLLHALAPHIRWRGIKTDAAALVQSCDACQRRRLHVPVPPEPQLPRLAGPMECVHMDLTGALPATRDMAARGVTKAYIMIMVDAFTKTLELAVLEDKSSLTCALAFLNHWLYRYPAPAIVVTDQGTEFLHEFEAALTRQGTNHISTRAHNPQANGNAERVVRSVKDTLRRTADDHVDVWPKLVPAMRAAHMATVHRSLGISPLEALTGLRDRCRLPTLPTTAASLTARARQVAEDHRTAWHISPRTSQQSTPQLDSASDCATLRSAITTACPLVERARQVANRREELRKRLFQGLHRTYERRLQLATKEAQTHRRAHPVVVGGKALVRIPPPKGGPKAMAPTVRGPYTVRAVGPLTATLCTGKGELFTRGLDQLVRFFSPSEAYEYQRRLRH